MVPLLAGALLASALLVLCRRLGPRGARRMLAAGLVIAAVIYLGFAAWAGTARWLALESAGVLLFGVPAWLGLRRTRFWLAAGWALHPVWDLWLHGSPGAAFVPSWYPVLCVGFDLVVALYLLGPTPGASTPPR